VGDHSVVGLEGVVDLVDGGDLLGADGCGGGTVEGCAAGLDQGGARFDAGDWSGTSSSGASQATMGHAFAQPIRSLTSILYGGEPGFRGDIRGFRELTRPWAHAPGDPGAQSSMYRKLSAQFVSPLVVAK